MTNKETVELLEQKAKETFDKASKSLVLGNDCGETHRLFEAGYRYQRAACLVQEAINLIEN